MNALRTMSLLSVPLFAAACGEVVLSDDSGGATADASTRDAGCATCDAEVSVPDAEPNDASVCDADGCETPTCEPLRTMAATASANDGNLSRQRDR